MRDLARSGRADVAPGSRSTRPAGACRSRIACCTGTRPTAWDPAAVGHGDGSLTANLARNCRSPSARWSCGSSAPKGCAPTKSVEVFSLRADKVRPVAAIASCHRATSTSLHGPPTRRVSRALHCGSAARPASPRYAGPTPRRGGHSDLPPSGVRDALSFRALLRLMDGRDQSIAAGPRRCRWFALAFLGVWRAASRRVGG